MCSSGATCLSRLLLLWTSTIKIQIKCGGLIQSRHHHHFIDCTCSSHDIADKLLIWHWETITLSNLHTFIFTHTLFIHYVLPVHTFIHYVLPVHTFIHYVLPVHTFIHYVLPVHTFTHYVLPVHTFIHYVLPVHTFDSCSITKIHWS
jgi:hypothetical protein